MLEINNISVQVDRFRLQDISFNISRGEYVILAGPSGAGKTMLLETIAGFRNTSRGSILINGKKIHHLAPYHRPVSMLFQDLGLFPHLSVEKNIGYAIHIRKLRHQKVKELAKNLSVDQYLHKKPEELSGGEKQRIALARALAAEPDILLLDEPLSSLDNNLRNELIQILYEINKAGQTIIHVTHDSKEALHLADKTGIIKNGHLIHWGKTSEIFHHIEDSFTAAFLNIENIIPVNDKMQVFLKEQDSTRYLAFYSSSIQFEKSENSFILEGRLIKRSSGQYWLDAEEGIIKMPALIEPQHRNYISVYIPFDKTYFLKH